MLDHIIILFSLFSPRLAGSEVFRSLFGAKFTELRITVATAGMVLSDVSVVKTGN